ncbi:MAG: tRNA (adenosine(37)-N6)-threonylcarbamoyltransferase complex ATPase subunit type 1 TsaE [Patescibacteria group bacterium]|nr:tRNA (adenosine(37)-N6)-threonylcarbamoyltransferase complex ATPase subunit type 1 TsaE [Patescibacteria group bacterium]
MIIKSTSKQTTQKLAEKIAKKLLKKRLKIKSGLVIGLQGNLGTGKTTFVQGFARGLKIKSKILSPTFVIMRVYPLKSKDCFLNFYHVDAYRIEKQKELNTIGLKKIINDPKNIILIEWVEKIKGMLPKKIFLIFFKHGRAKNERIIQFKTL